MRARRLGTWLIRLLAIVGVLSMIVSCSLAVSFDGYHTRAHRPDAAADDDSSDGEIVDSALSDERDHHADADATSAGPLYGVSGVVSGLDGSKVRLGLGVKEIEVRDGPFAFPPALVSGANFVVDVLAQPVGRVCHVEHATGVIAAAEAAGVLVICEPAIAQLAIVCIPNSAPAPCLSNATLFPALAPGVLDYTVVLRATTFAFAVAATAAQPGSTVKITGPVLPGVNNGYFYPSPGPNLVTIDVTAPDGATHAAYHFTVIVDGTHYIKASNGRAGAAFGAAVAIEGDTLVVGAPGESSNAVGEGGVQSDTSSPDAGAVYVFARSLTSNGYVWSQTAYIKPSNTRAGARFGSAVVLSGTTLVVASDAESSGASGIGGNESDSSATGAGAVYVFERAGGVWSQAAYIKASNASADARFGTSVALSGTTLAVGAPGEASAASGINEDQASVAAPGAGAAYVFTRAGATWSQQAYVKASNARSAARFGTAVSVNGERLGVGAPGDSSASTGLNGSQSAGGAVGTGAVYTLLRSGTTWSYELFAKAALAPQANGGFASSVAVTKKIVMAGWPVLDAVATFAFSPGFGWSANSVYALPPPSSGHAPSVICPALDYDTYLVVLGSPLEVGGGVVELAGQQPPPTNLAKPNAPYPRLLRATNPRANALFGAAIGFSGSTLAVGSPAESSNATAVDGNQADTSAPVSGAVYVY